MTPLEYAFISFTCGFFGIQGHPHRTGLFWNTGPTTKDRTFLEYRVTHEGQDFFGIQSHPQDFLEYRATHRTFWNTEPPTGLFGRSKLKWMIELFLKGTVSIIWSFLKVRNAEGTLAEKPQMKIHSLNQQKHTCLINAWSEIVSKGPVVNKALLSLHGAGGSLKIVITKMLCGTENHI